MKTNRILLVEDSPAYLETVSFGLNDEPDIEVIGKFTTADAALRKLKSLSELEQPNLILLDLNMPGIHGLLAIPQFKSCSPKSEIIILTESNKEADILSAISLGAVGYLLKESSMDQITEGIRTVMEGGASIDPVMARYILNSHKHDKDSATQKSILSQREMEIITRLADGLAQKQIADELNISPKTVDFHVGHIYKKLNAKNAPSAVAKAYQRGIFRSKG